MGEVDAAPAAPAKPMPDLTSLEVDPNQGERLYKAAFIKSKQGDTYRLISKTLSDGNVDLVYYICDLDADGTQFGKRRIRRIHSQPADRFDREIEAIKKEIIDNGEEVQGVWSHDLTALTDIPAQSSSLEDWTVQIAKDIGTP